MRFTTLFLAFLIGSGWASAQADEPLTFAEFMQKAGHIHGIAVNPKDSSQLYVATHHGLYMAGANGQAVTVSEDKHDFMGFAVHPSAPDTLYGSGHPAGGGNLGFIASSDNGKTWRQLSPGVKGPVDFHAMTVSPADPQVIYGTHGGLQVSRDGGLTWEIVGPLPGKVIDLAASGAAADTVYAGTADGLLVSEDSGRSWRSAYPATKPVPLVEAGKDGVIYAFMVDIGLLKLQDGNWNRLAGDFGERYFLHLAVDPSQAERLYAVTGDGELLASADGGQNWQPFGR